MVKSCLNGEKAHYVQYVYDIQGNKVRQFTGMTAPLTLTVTEVTDAADDVNPDSKDDNSFRYCGEYYDKETEEIYLRARYYQPTVGRFLTRDSYTGEAGEPESLHLYAYCVNDGVNKVDPSGREYWELATAAGGTMALADGPFPYGDIVGGVVIVGGLAVDGIMAICAWLDSKDVNYNVSKSSSKMIAMPQPGPAPNSVRSRQRVGSLAKTNMTITINHKLNNLSKVSAKFHVIYLGRTHSGIRSFYKYGFVARKHMSKTRVKRETVKIVRAARSKAKSKGKSKSNSDTGKYKNKKKVKGKQKDDIPDRFKGERPLKGESGKEAARRVLQKYGEYDPKKTGPNTPFNKLKNILILILSK